MKNEIQFYALPGFLGESEDFSQLQTALSHKGTFKWNFLDRFELEPHQLGTPHPFSVGIGYSLGGRRLLELAQANPNFFKAVIFLSTHPGLENEHEKVQRLNADLIWAHKLENLSSVDFFDEWNTQPALRSSLALERNLNQEQKKYWANILKKYSLAHQPNYLLQLGAMPIPQLWLAGEQDSKFIELLSRVQDLKAQQITTAQIKGAGHRLLQVHIDQLANNIFDFLNQITH